LEAMMKKRLNLRFILYLLGSLAVLGTGTHFLHGYQVRRNAHALFDQAQAAEQQGQLDQAADCLGRYLALAPDDLDALAHYGTLLADERLATSFQAKQRALLVLNRVLFRDPQRDDVCRKAVRLAIDLGLYAEARVDLNRLLQLQDFKDDGELKLLLARCYERTAAYKEARKRYEQAIKDAPHELDAAADLARLLRERTQDVLAERESTADAIQKADQAIDNMVRANERSYRAYLLRVAYLKQYKADDPKKPGKVAEDVARAQELSGEAAEVLLAAADRAEEEGALDKARALLRRGCELHAQNAAMYRALARLEARAGDTKEAVRQLRRGLEKLPKQLDLLWDLADLLSQSGQKSEAAEVIAQLKQEGFPAGYLQLLNARLLIHEGHWQEAARLLEEAAAALAARTGAPDERFAAPLAHQANLLLGRCYEQLGDADRAVAAYSRVVVRDSRSVPGRLGMAMNLWAAGRLPEALDQYQQLTRLREELVPPVAWVEVARLTLLRNLGRDVKERNWAEVEQALAQASNRLKPPPPALVLLQAEALAAQDPPQYGKARDLLLENYREPKARPAEVWAGLAALEERQGRAAAAQLEEQGRAEAARLETQRRAAEAQKERERGAAAGLAWLDEAAQHVGDHVDLRLARARLLVGRAPGEARAALAKLSEGATHFAAADRQRLLRGLANALLQTGDAAAAERLWEELARLQPGDVRSRLMLFELAAQAGNNDAMQKWIEELKGIEKDDGVLWHYATARSLIEQVRRGEKVENETKAALLAEARTQIAAVAARRPNWSRVPLCEAYIDDLGGRAEAALPNYLKALQMGESDLVATLRAAELLSRYQRYAEADRLFRDHFRDQTLLPHEAQMVAAEAALRSQETARALSLAKAAVPGDSKDYRHHLWLGRMYYAADQRDQAGAEFARARDLAGAEPDTWVALVQFLAATGQKEKARAEVEAAQRRLTGPAVPLALARCYEVIDRADRAGEMYRTAVEAAPNDPAARRGAAEFCLRSGRFPEAEDHLKKLMEVSRGKSPDTYASARRLLAYLQVLKGDPAGASKALALLGQDGSDPSRSQGVEAVMDRRTRAQLLALQNSRESRRDAVKVLEGLIEERLATPEDFFLAAQLYEVLGAWPKARQRFLGLLELPHEDTPLRLAVVARSLLRHGEVGEAQKVLETLKARDPQSFLTREITARLLHAQGESAKAAALVKEYAESEGADLRAAAALLVEFGDHDEAEPLLRRFVAQSKQPESVLVLIRYLIGRKNYREALDLCDRAWETCPPVAVADACLQALAAAPADPQLTVHFEGRLRAAAQKHPDRPELLVALATVLNFQGRFDESIQLFRRALDRDPHNGTALNNLAWLLALRGGRADEAAAREALALAERAVQVVGRGAGVLDTRAVAALAVGQPKAVEQAVRDLESVTEEAPTAAYYYHLAQAYTQLRQPREAARAWQRAKALGLSADGLHPLERPAYERLRQELN
jgi:tetratricopeptide (TPR) repeat protein